MACCGSSHAVAVSENGQLYAWGSSAQRGQLGLADRDPRCLPTRVTAFDGQRPAVILVPPENNTRPDPASRAAACGHRLLLAAAGGAHTVAVGQRGELWSWGHGGHGALGLGDDADRLVPTRVSAEHFQSPVAFAAASYYHTAAVTEHGGLWTWGEGSDGQLGHGDLRKALVPTRVRGLGCEFGAGRSVLHVACGFSHTLAVTDHGNMWSWGWGGDGTLGHGDFQTRRNPSLIDPKLFGHHILLAAAGAAHSLAVASNGKVFSWGKNSHG